VVVVLVLIVVAVVFAVDTAMHHTNNITAPRS
jgi:hypothetical protein